jgi:hypothetical protein
MKMQLNISGLAKRSDNLPLVRVGKFGGHSLILRLVYPSISLLPPIQYPENQSEINALAPALCQYLFKHPDSMMPF